MLWSPPRGSPLEQSCHQERPGPPSKSRGPARNMNAMAASEALRAPEGHPKRGSNVLKLGLRIVVSAALLVFLVTKIPSDSVQPKDTHAGTLTFLAAALALTFAGFVLSAWRWQRVLAVFDVAHPPEDAARLLPRRSVRGQRAPVHDRGRRPPHQPRRRRPPGATSRSRRSRSSASPASSRSHCSRSSASPSDRRSSTSRTRGSRS